MLRALPELKQIHRESWRVNYHPINAIIKSNEDQGIDEAFLDMDFLIIPTDLLITRNGDYIRTIHVAHGQGIDVI